MDLIRKFSADKLHTEYGLDGIRTFPWAGVTPPLGGGYCIVRPGNDTLDHVNSPGDEDEMFIAVQGNAKVGPDGKASSISQGDVIMIPRGMSHFIRNTSDAPFQFCTVWWSSADVARYQAAKAQPRTGGRLMEDVIIIGGGLSGASLLYAFQQRGLSALMVEDSVVGGGGATAHSRGMVRVYDPQPELAAYTIEGLRFWATLAPIPPRSMIRSGWLISLRRATCPGSKRFWSAPAVPITACAWCPPPKLPSAAPP